MTDTKAETASKAAYKQLEEQIKTTEQVAIEVSVDNIILRHGLERHRALVEPMLRGAAKVRQGGMVFRNDGGEAVSEHEYISELRKTAPQLFEAPVKKTNTESGPNPFKAGPSWNLTRQFEIARTDPERARKLELEAERAKW